MRCVERNLISICHYDSQKLASLLYWHYGFSDKRFNNGPLI